MKRLFPRRRWISLGVCGCMLAVLVPGLARGGVIAHWSFDELDPDGTYHDSANNAHPATPADKAAVQTYSGGAPAPFGKAITLLGQSSPNSYLTIPPLTNIQTTSFTVAAWVNLASQNSAFVLADWPTMAQSSYAFGFHPFGSNKATAQPTGNITSTELVGGRGTDSGNRRSIVSQKLADKGVPLNQWHHVAWAWDRDSGTLTFYFDGDSWAEAKRTPPNAAYSKSLDMAVNNLPVRIGAQELSVGQGPANLTGSLDELWIFDEALLPIPIRNLMKNNDIHSVPPPTTTNLVAVTTGASSRGGPDIGPVIGSGSATTGSGPSPTPVMGSGNSVKLASASERSSPGRTAGIVMCLTVIVTSACYLVWAFAERAKLRSGRGYR